jgi:hypothetical protein
VIQRATKCIRTIPLQANDIYKLALSAFLIFLVNFTSGQKRQAFGKSFLPDTTINSVLKLLDPSSIRKSIGNQRSKMIEDEGPVRVQITNKRGDEFLILYQSEGANENSFNEFEVGLIKSHNKPFRPSLFESFSTECGVHLGITKDSLIMLKGSDFVSSTINGRMVLTYKISEQGNKVSNNSILNRYNMPEYRAAYYFLNLRLVKFVFGFPNP